VSNLVDFAGERRLECRVPIPLSGTFSTSTAVSAEALLTGTVVVFAFCKTDSTKVSAFGGVFVSLLVEESEARVPLLVVFSVVTGVGLDFVGDVKGLDVEVDIIGLVREVTLVVAVVFDKMVVEADTLVGESGVTMGSPFVGDRVIVVFAFKEEGTVTTVLVAIILGGGVVIVVLFVMISLILIVVLGVSVLTGELFTVIFVGWTLGVDCGDGLDIFTQDLLLTSGVVLLAVVLEIETSPEAIGLVGELTRVD